MIKRCKRHSRVPVAGWMSKALKPIRIISSAILHKNLFPTATPSGLFRKISKNRNGEKDVYVDPVFGRYDGRRHLWHLYDVFVSNQPPLIFRAISCRFPWTGKTAFLSSKNGTKTNLILKNPEKETAILKSDKRFFLVST